VKCVKSCQFTKPCVFLNAYLQTFSVFQTYQQSKQSFTVKVLLFIDTNFRCFYKMQWTMGSWIHGFIDPWVLEFMVSLIHGFLNSWFQTWHAAINGCLLPLMLWVRISISARCTTLCDKVCHWLAIGQCYVWVLRFPPPIKLIATI
jgi:hypothetical protein